jgi:SAM-dependent methyltransferase
VSVPLCQSALRQWFAEPLGREIWEAERAQLEHVLPNLFGYHILQLGSVGDQGFLSESRILHRVVVDSGVARADLYALPEALPVLTDSVDVAVLPHTLEFGKDPHGILREVVRCLIAGGHVVVLGFNPWSFWGLRRLVSGGQGKAPWCGRFLSLTQVKDWLSLLGFDTLCVKTFFFRPPLNRSAAMKRLEFMESLGNRGWIGPAGAYVLLARKRVVALTPIRPRWRPRRRLITAGVTEPTARGG